MMISGTLLAVIAVLVLAGAILWANPRRLTNIAVTICSLNVAAWLFCLHLMFSVDLSLGLPWLRLTTAVGGLIPYSLWLVKEAIASQQAFTLRHAIVRGGGWLVACLVLAVIPFTQVFIPDVSTSENRVYGIGYYGYISGFILLCGLLFQRTVARMRSLTGLPRLELQVWTLGGTAACVTVVLMMALRTFFSAPLNFQAFVVLCFYAFTAIAITTHRIFDARHIILNAAQRLLLLIAVSVATYASFSVLRAFVADGIDFLMTVAFMLWFSSWANARLDAWLLRYPKAVQARHAAFNAAQSEVRTEPLRAVFRKVLNGWGQTDRSLLLIDDDGVMEADGVSLETHGPILAALEEVQWATPERLDRERETPERRRLASFLRENNLGVLVWEKGPTMKLVVGVGVRPSRRPFTFPEVNQLRELSSIFESALSRTELLAKAQRAEQLATVGLLGASVAHEIRNPLVSIKTFAQLLPKHYDDPNFRERFSRLIGEEVSRIDRLTEQLLDLAAPRNFQRSAISLHEITQASVDLVGGRVAASNLKLNSRFMARPDTVWSDPNGLKQVIINLCFNAVQAQEVRGQDATIVVDLETRNIDRGIELIVADNGPGIPPEARHHLFEPFHSTKSNGFGLGLTICGDILATLDSTITLDPYVAGCGAVFRVTLPCPPLSS